MKKIIRFAAVAFIAAASVGAADAKRLSFDEQMSKWEKTGKTQNCLNLSSIDSTQVWDDQHILFEMKGKKAYLNTLPQACPRLGFEGRFMYKTSLNAICDLDLITVIDPTSNIQGPTCGLGKFEEVTKKAVDAAQK